MNCKLIFFICVIIYGSQIQISTSDGPDSIDFLYLVLQWPGSQCNTKQGCCYPPTKKPSNDFIVDTLQPYYFNGTWPEYCDSNNHFNFSKVVDLKKSLAKTWPSLSCPRSGGKKLWAEAWRKYGTCSVSVKGQFTERQYFSAALKLKKMANLLKVLASAGITPNGKSYQVGTMLDAIVGAGLHFPGLVCNVDKNGKSQLSRVWLCADPTVSTFVECPGVPLGSCDETANFPSTQN